VRRNLALPALHSRAGPFCLTPSLGPSPFFFTSTFHITSLWGTFSFHPAPSLPSRLAVTVFPSNHDSLSPVPQQTSRPTDCSSRLESLRINTPLWLEGVPSRTALVPVLPEVNLPLKSSPCSTDLFSARPCRHFAPHFDAHLDEDFRQYRLSSLELRNLIPFTQRQINCPF